jgi:hypothetical protein
VSALTRILNESWRLERPETAAQNHAIFDPSKHPALRFGDRMLSPWFKGTERPVRPGVYRRRGEGIFVSEAFAYWSGTHWFYAGETIEEAQRNYEWKKPTRLQPQKEHDYPTEWQGLLSEFLTPSYLYDTYGHHE